ncbi:repressor of RNA polymerase III transcription MAF1 homolog [Halichondria panicea]|uniref:repressor of RNA polymerase III transcription MAF1 homolog n=1 Tax=Halichondria panicea TaxID=6063 RepID=UPI00312B5B0E
MKLLENAKLDSISSALCMNTGDCTINGRVESYSCKMAGSDKKLYKQLSHPNSGESPTNRQALSPCTTFVGSPCSPMSPTGVPTYLIRQPSGSSTNGLTDTPQLCDTASNKILFYLRSTLTASFQPDYVFTDAKSDEFSRVPSVKWVMDAVRSNLSAIAGDMFTTLENALWAAIDEEITLSDCDIYSYNSDFSDSYGEEGALWSFNYFFYNKKLKRIVFFTCQALSPTVERGDNDVEDIDDLTDLMELDQTNDSAYDSFSTGVLGDPGWQLPAEMKTN